MVAAAMIDAGADKDVLLSALSSIPAEGFKVEIRNVMRNGIECCDFAVMLDEEHENHDHDMNYLYGSERTDNCCHRHHSHNHHGHEHSHHGGEPSHHEHHNHEEEIEDEEELSLNMHEIISHVEAHIHKNKKKKRDVSCKTDTEISNTEDICAGKDDDFSEIADVNSKIDNDFEKTHDNESEAHEADHESHEHSHDHGHRHCHGHHEYSHDGDEHSHGHHVHRNIDDVLEIINKTDMTEGARRIAVRIFDIIAAAETKAHAVPLNQVHFHEVGAIDSIVDVIAIAVCYDSLLTKYDIKDVYFPCISEGMGTVRCQHGVLPVPVPATANIAAEYGIPMRIINAGGELATPTGMAFVAAVGTKFCLPPAFKIVSSGMGAGKRNYEIPSIVRAMVIDTECPVNDQKKNMDETELGKNCANPASNDCQICLLETNLDDCSGEALGFTMEELIKAGARDVHYIPCYMKKCRPAYILNVICDEDKIAIMEEIIFRHTSTIGIRRIRMERTVLLRKTITLESQYGKFKAKESVYGNLRKISPEYEDVAEICRRSGLPFAQVYAELQKKCDTLY